MNHRHAKYLRLRARGAGTTLPQNYLPNGNLPQVSHLVWPVVDVVDGTSTRT
jgi:hypothetical protein